MTLTLAEEVALLGYGHDGAPKIGRQVLDYGIAGAVLLDLALAGRIDVVANRLVVCDPTPTGSPVLDQALRSAATDHPRRAPEWIKRLVPGLREAVLDNLVRTGVLRREDYRVLGLFRYTRFPSSTGTMAAAESDLRYRLIQAVTTDGPVPPRTAAMCGLVRAMRIERKVFRDQPGSLVHRRLRQISRGDWASDAVKRAVDEVHAAAVAAIAAASAAVIVSSS